MGLGTEHGRRMEGRRARMRARDNYDNHFVCEPRAKETGQNEEDERDGGDGDAYDLDRIERWMKKKKIMMMMTMTTGGNRFPETPLVSTTVGRFGVDDISVVVVN